jgi:hypothetical protein
MRYNQVGLNFQKTDAEIKDALIKDLSQSAKEFKLISAQRIKLGGEDAFRTEFSFLDPTGNIVRLSQVLTSHAGADYILVCGTGDYQYKYFQKDFQNFFDTFSWQSE